MYAFAGTFSASAKDLTLTAQTGSLDLDMATTDRDATQSVDSTSITYYIKATLDINSHLQDVVHDSTTDGLDDAYGLDSFTVTSATSGATFAYNIPGGSSNFDLGEVSVRDVNYATDSGVLTPNSGSNFQLAVTLQINANAGYEFTALLTGADSLTYTTADFSEDLSKAQQVYWNHDTAPTVASDAADVLSAVITKTDAASALSTELAAINSAETDSTAAGSIFQSWSIVVEEVSASAAGAVDNIVSKIARKNAAAGDVTLSTSSPVAFKQGDELLVGSGIVADHSTLTVNVTGGTGGSLALGSDSDTIYGILVQS
jgi:hypothetical protein